MEWIFSNWDKLLTVLFAGLSVLFACLSFFILYLEYKRNNPSPTVKINRSFALLPTGNVDGVTGTIVNEGRRPIVLNKLTFLMGNNLHLHLSPESYAFWEDYPNYPITLGEMESFNVTVMLETLKAAKKEHPAGLRAICFHDTTGKIYKGKMKKKFWKELY